MRGPALGRVYAECNVTYDDTLFPIPYVDWRVLGFDDTKEVTRLSAASYGKALAKEDRLEKTDNLKQYDFQMPLSLSFSMC